MVVAPALKPASRAVVVAQEEARQSGIELAHRAEQEEGHLARPAERASDGEAVGRDREAHVEDGQVRAELRHDCVDGAIPSVSACTTKPSNWS